MKNFGREAVEQGADVLACKIGSLASRYGENAITALRKVGPWDSRFADDAGAHAPVAFKHLAGHDDDAIRLVARPINSLRNQSVGFHGFSLNSHRANVFAVSSGERAVL